ncbi:MAG TPA: hypothetical protein VFQ22_00280, partial [Longimicrobiales bacterium]|nr:hypothetical protein [Longimicrobiales bacterium]
ASGNTPPRLSFGAAQGAGPLGVTAPERVRARVGQPVELKVSGRDDAAAAGPDLAAAFSGAAGGRGGPAPQVTVAWFKHQGPGEVTFSPERGRFPASGGEHATMATFSQPGEYVVRVRATDSAIAQAGHAQCCWTNGYVNVTVAP